MIAKQPSVDITSLKVACHNCRLNELCLPRGLDLAEMDRLDSIVSRGRPLRRGEHLYRQGDRLNALFAVRSGSLRSYAVSHDGTEQTIGFYLPGELVGLDALEHDEHTCATVALETTTVCQLPYGRLEELCAILPSLQHQLLRLVGKELSSDHEILLLLGTRSAEERLAAFLLSLSKRFTERGFSAYEFNLSMSRHDIADFLGIAVETVSRQFSNFQKAGMLRVKHRNVRILDMDRLRGIVSPCLNRSAAVRRCP